MQLGWRTCAGEHFWLPQENSSSPTEPRHLELLAGHQTCTFTEQFNSVGVQRAPFCCLMEWDGSVPLLSSSKSLHFHFTWCHLRPRVSPGRAVMLKAWAGASTAVSTCIYRTAAKPEHGWSGSFSGKWICTWLIHDFVTCLNSE